MPHRNVLALGEANAEQTGGTVEGGLDHVIERQIRLDRGVVEIGSDLAQLFGIIAPVPRRQREIAALLRHQRLQGVAVGHRPRPRRLPDPLQQPAHRFRCLGHRILQPIGGKGGEAEQLRAFLAQRQDFDDGLVVVVGVVVVAARRKRLEDLLAQVAPGRTLQERLDERPRQRHHDFAGHAALLGGRPCGGDETLRQPLAIGLAEFHEPFLLVAQQMMAERGAEMRQPLIDLGHPCLGRLVEAGAGAVEARIGTLQQPRLLAGQAERGAVVAQQRDAAEQHGVHHDRVPVARHPQRHFLVDLQQRRVGMGRHQVVKHRRHPGEQLARALQRRDGVGEIRRGGIVGDRRDLGGMIGEGLLEGGQEMLGRDLGEWRGLERRLPRLEKRVCGAPGGVRRRQIF